MKKVSREGAGALLPALPDSPVSPVEALGISLAEDSREDHLTSAHPAPGAGLVEAGSVHRTHRRSSSECFNDFGRTV